VLATALSADDPAQLRQRRDIPYVAVDPHRRQMLDAWWPIGESSAPIVVYIHGGGWRGGDKGNVGLKPEAFGRAGFAFVSVNYRLHPQTDFRGQATDVALAIRHVVEHAAAAGADPERIFLIGHSAGAHLAALVATDGSYLEAAGLELSRLKGVVLLDGAAYDIPRQISLTGGPRSEARYAEVFGATPESQRQASPITHVAADKGIPPFLILPIDGRLDSGVQSDAFAERLRVAGVEARVVRCPGETHGSINQLLGTPGQLATDETLKFVKSRSAPSPARASSPATEPDIAPASTTPQDAAPASSTEPAKP